MRNMRERERERKMKNKMYGYYREYQGYTPHYIIPENKIKEYDDLARQTYVRFGAVAGDIEQEKAWFKTIEEFHEKFDRYEIDHLNDYKILMEEEGK